jgi:predicted GNAT family acetyltransferase
MRQSSCLIAMAGERMRCAGMAELSGVCTRPDTRGQGRATRLSAHVVRAILARGEVPILHVWKTNHGAIALYEKLGFGITREMDVAVFERPAR